MVVDVSFVVTESEYMPATVVVDYLLEISGVVTLVMLHVVIAVADIMSLFLLMDASLLLPTIMVACSLEHVAITIVGVVVVKCLHSHGCC